MSRLLSNPAVFGRGIDRYDYGRESDVSPSLAARLASYPLLGLQKLLQPLLLPGDATRALLGYLSGAELTDKGAFGIPTVSGERLLNQLGIDMGPNVKGRAEWRDVPGFLAEIALDPINLVNPFPGLTRAGKLAKAAGEGSATARAARVVDRALAKEEIAGVRGIERKLGDAPKRLASTLAEQGRSGQWAPFRLDVPFTDINRPILPDAVNERIGALLGGTGRALGGMVPGPIARGYESLDRLFRLRGEVAPWSPNAEKINAQSRVARMLSRRGAREGTEVSHEIRRALAGQSAADATRLLDELGTSTDRRVQELLNELAPQNEKIKASLAAGDDAGAARAAAAADRNMKRAQRLGFAPKDGFTNRDPVKSLLLVGAEHRDVAARTASYAERLTQKTEERISNRIATAWEADLKQFGEAENIGFDFALDPELSATVEKMTAGERVVVPRQFKNTRKAIAESQKTRRQLASRVSVLMAKQEIAGKVMSRIAAENEPMMQIINRYGAVVGDTLKRERAIGVNVSELTDPMLSYVHRAVRPGGNALSEYMGQRAPHSIAARSTNQFDVVRGFMHGRTPELRGLGIAQANDVIRNDAIEHLTRAFDGDAVKAQKYVDQLLGGSTFFEEDPAEIMLRRLSQSGLAQENAFYINGLMEMFSAPIDNFKVAKRNHVPLAEAFSRLESIGGLPGEASILPRKGETVTEGLRFTAKDAKVIEEQLEMVGLGGHAVPQDILDQAIRVHKVFSNPRETRPFLDWFDKYNSAMRFFFTSVGIKIPDKIAQSTPGRAVAGGAIGAGLGAALAGPVGAIGLGAAGAAGGAIAGVVPLFPGFFVRNAHTNGFMMWMAGMGPQDAGLLVEAGQLQKLARRALQKGEAAATPSESAALLKVRRAHDLFGGNFATETAEVLNQGRSGRLDSVLNPSKTEYGRRSLDLNSTIEDNNKLAMFLFFKKKGYTDIAAGDKVKEFLFDYGELGDFEKMNVRRKAFFWTWQRKALPLMFKQLYHNPAKMRLVARAGESGSQNELLQAHQQNRLLIPGPAGLSKNGERTFLDFDLPPNTLNIVDPEDRVGWSAWKRAGQKVLAQFAPTLRVPLEIASGTDFRTGRSRGNIPAQLLSGTPAGRVANTISNLGRRGAEGVPGMLGLPIIKVDPAKAQARSRLDRIQKILEEEYASGRAKQFTSYYTQDEANKDRLAALLSEESRLRRMLRE